jgi:hypothetical protein
LLFLAIGLGELSYCGWVLCRAAGR